MNTRSYLSVNAALCNTCSKALPISGDYVKCLNCNKKYHYSPCTTLSESSYSVMSAEKKTTWKCQNCRGEKSKSPSNLYTSITYENNTQPEETQIHSGKQIRDIDNSPSKAEETNTKRFKDYMSINAMESNVTELRSDLASMKTSVSNDMSEIKTSIQQLCNNIATTNNALREEMSMSFLNLTQAMTNLTTQVNDLKEQNKSKDRRIEIMENKINVLEQQLIKKNIEIKNVPNKELSAMEVIKTIAESVNVEIHDNDISNAYTLNKSEKRIIEFCSLNKKKELMMNIRGHRVKGEIFNTNISSNVNENTTNNNVFINDQLTPNNHKLLWLTKNKSREANWKFVWTRNGNIYAKKDESNKPLIISNLDDIEKIA